MVLTIADKDGNVVEDAGSMVYRMITRRSLVRPRVFKPRWLSTPILFLNYTQVMEKNLVVF